MNTQFLLMAQYNGLAVIPLDVVCRDYFSHLKPAELARKAARGEIPLPITMMERSQKAARGVHIADLAEWIDRRREVARKEQIAMECRVSGT